MSTLVFLTELQAVEEPGNQTTLHHQTPFLQLGRSWGGYPPLEGTHHPFTFDIMSGMNFCPKTRLDGHHQNHVHERDKRNHLLHWRPWFDANTNLQCRGGRREWKGKGEGRQGRERKGAEGIGEKKKGKGGEEHQEINLRNNVPRTDSLALRMKGRG